MIGRPFFRARFNKGGVLQLCLSGRIGWADMVLAPAVAGLFKWRQFEPEAILLAVGWYFCAFRFPIVRAGPARRPSHRLEAGPTLRVLPD